MEYAQGANCVKVIPTAGRRKKPIIIQGYFKPESEKETRERFENLAKNFQKFGIKNEV